MPFGNYLVGGTDYAILKDANGDTVSVTTWESSNPAVFTVTAPGAITAVAPGVAVLRAKNGSNVVIYSTPITVAAASATARYAAESTTPPPANPTWTTLGDMTVSNGGATLTRTTGTSNWNNPATTDAAPRSGGLAIQADADTTSSDWMLGFIDSTVTYTGYASISYAIENSNGSLLFYQAGSNVSGSSLTSGTDVSTSHVTGDDLRIEMSAGGVVVAKKNGAVMLTFPATASATNYKIIAAIFDPASPIVGLTLT
jgi:hypothetical protein